MTGATCGAGNTHSFRNTWCQSLWEFMISPIHYIYIIYYWICQFYDYVYGLMTGLFALISLSALSRTYFILHDSFQTWCPNFRTADSKMKMSRWQLRTWHLAPHYIYRVYQKVLFNIFVVCKQNTKRSHRIIYQIKTHILLHIIYKFYPDCYLKS